MSGKVAWRQEVPVDCRSCWLQLSQSMQGPVHTLGREYSHRLQFDGRHGVVLHAANSMNWCGTLGHWYYVMNVGFRLVLLFTRTDASV